MNNITIHRENEYISTQNKNKHENTKSSAI